MADRQVDRGLRERGRGLSSPPDVAIIGGGIVGCAAAAVLAETGARVELHERDEVAAAASGRNSGVVQHPFDPVLAGLHAETLTLLRGLEGFELGPEPAGLLMLAHEQARVEGAAAAIDRQAPELRPTVLDPGELQRLEPALAPGLAACRLETGYPARPEVITRAFARRAYSLGAVFHEHESAWPWVGSGRARGVIAAGVRRPAGAVLVAAGPWTPELVDPTRVWRPIVPVWGVVIEAELREAPRHVVEEAGVEEVAAVEEAAAGPGATAVPGSLFSAVTAGGITSVGSTFLSEEPDPAAWAATLLARGSEFLPELAQAEIRGTRACARPQSLDGRPLVGEVDGARGLWLAAGHGPWGISTGPATARLAADAMLGRAAVPAPLAASRAGVL